MAEPIPEGEVTENNPFTDEQRAAIVQLVTSAIKDAINPTKEGKYIFSSIHRAWGPLHLIFGSSSTGRHAISILSVMCARVPWLLSGYYAVLWAGSPHRRMKGQYNLLSLL